jgi:hypothetical protein
VASFAPHPIGDVIIPEEPLSAFLVEADQPIKADQPTPEQENSRPNPASRRSTNEVDLAREEPTVSAKGALVDNPAGLAPHPSTTNGTGKIAGAVAVPPGRKPHEPASGPAEAIARHTPRASQPVIVLVWVSHARSG